MTQTDTKSITLAAALDFPAAAELAADLRDLRQDPVMLDASAVQHLGAPCLQVLLAAARSWHADALAFSVQNPSLAFVEGLARLGCDASEISLRGGAS